MERRSLGLTFSNKVIIYWPHRMVEAAMFLNFWGSVLLAFPKLSFFRTLRPARDYFLESWNKLWGVNDFSCRYSSMLLLFRCFTQQNFEMTFFLSMIKLLIITLTNFSNLIGHQLP